MIAFEVRGIPKPKGSTRAFPVRMKGGAIRAVVTNDCKAARPWEESVRAEARKVAPAVPLDCALSVRLVFWLPRPKSVSVKQRPHATAKPDVDKLARLALDACTGVIWRDDAQVVALRAEKRYRDAAGVRVEIEEELP